MTERLPPSPTDYLKTFDEIFHAVMYMFSFYPRLLFGCSPPPPFYLNDEQCPSKTIPVGKFLTEYFISLFWKKKWLFLCRPWLKQFLLLRMLMHHPKKKTKKKMS